MTADTRLCRDTRQERWISEQFSTSVICRGDRRERTYADTLHEEGVSVNTIRIRLGHESLDVTLAYLKGKDAESEEAQEHANSSSLALYA